MAYQEIINEIIEQIDEITANIAQYQQDIVQMQADIQEKENYITEFQQRIEGLNQLRVNAQTLSDQAGSSVVVNVTNAFSTSTPV
jgi:uncharacterized coiled-coil DUF342 family protein